MAGAKIPNINWAGMFEAIAFPLDHIRDQMEVWRTRPDMFVKGLVERAHSTIIFDGYPENERFSQACMDAMRSRMHISHLQYAAWSQAATLFEELDNKGLNTSASVMKAIKTDRELLGRVAAMVCHVLELQRWWCGKLPQVLTSCKAIRPYFIRKRLPTGSAIVIKDSAYCKRHPPKDKSIEFVLAGLYETTTSVLPAPTHLREIHKAIQNPKEAEKFTAEAYDTIGDYAIAVEFTDGFTQSSFGQDLTTLVKEAIQDGSSKSWFPFLSGMDQEKVTEVDDEPHVNRFGSVESFVKVQALEWLSVCFAIDAKLAVTLMVTTDTWGWMEYDILWRTVDQILWQEAENLQCAPGRLAKLFGLFDPLDKNRPTAGEAFLRELSRLIDVADELFRPEIVPDQPFVSSIPVATPQDSVAKAPERGSFEPKVKVKKKKAKAGQSTESPPPPPPQAQPVEIPEEDEPDENIPELLPKNWKLNKRTVDVSHPSTSTA
ncbi:hypothetical protein FRC00_009195 [Tulasnella sp. 408]|nr:hypothetical protein FRC00_009195 [Tulasnella sp. 408]